MNRPTVPHLERWDVLEEPLTDREERHPEGAEARKQHAGKRVAGPELDDAGNQLRKAAEHQSHAKHNRCHAHGHGLSVDHAEHERGHSKGEER